MQYSVLITRPPAFCAQEAEQARHVQPEPAGQEQEPHCGVHAQCAQEQRQLRGEPAQAGQPYCPSRLSIVTRVSEKREECITCQLRS